MKTGREKEVSCDAALDFKDDRAKTYIVGGNCGDICSQLARELKACLRTDTLPEQLRVPVDRITEDVAAWLDKNPDQFEGRLQQVLLRHFPILARVVETPGPRELVPRPAPGDVPPEGGPGPVPGPVVFVPGEEEEKPPFGGEDDDSQPLLLPDISSQAVVLTARTPEEFSPFDKRIAPGKGGKRPSRHITRRLTDEQRTEIGRRAEMHALNKEVEKLIALGRPDLAEKVVDRNKDGYDPNGPYDIDSFDLDETGWRPIMVEVKGHLDDDAYWFDMSENEIRLALAESSTPYMLYLVLNLAQHDVHIETFDFRRLWREERLHCQARTLRVELRPIEDEAAR